MVALGIGAGVLVIGATYAVLAKRAGDEYGKSGDTSDASNSRLFARMMFGSLYTGIGLLAAGVVLRVTSPSNVASTGATVAVAPFDRGAAFVVSGRW